MDYCNLKNLNWRSDLLTLYQWFLDQSRYFTIVTLNIDSWNCKIYIKWLSNKRKSICVGPPVPPPAVDPSLRRIPLRRISLRRTTLCRTLPRSRLRRSVPLPSEPHPSGPHPSNTHPSGPPALQDRDFFWVRAPTLSTPPFRSHPLGPTLRVPLFGPPIL